MNLLHMHSYFPYMFMWIVIGLLQVTRIDSCDQISRQCLNGACQQQADLKMGCTCHPGYILDPINPLVCNAIPPCNMIPGPSDQQCTNGLCLPNPGTGQYACQCHPGYQLSPANQNFCDDIDECLTSATGCAPGMCFNFPGDFACSGCLPGYTLVIGKCEVTSMVEPAFKPEPRPRPNSMATSILMAYMIDDVFL